MADICFKFKLNLGKDVILKYTSAENGWETLETKVIPSALEQVIGNGIKVNHYIKYNVIQPTKETMLSSTEYKKMVEKCNPLEKDYFTVVNSYQEKHGIFWPDDFLEHTKPNARQSIDDFLSSYPLLDNIVEVISDNDVNEDLKSLSKFGHGRTAIILYRKVVKALKEFDDSNRSSWFFIYDTSSETILIPAEYGVTAVKELSKSLEATINATKNNKIGKVSILPLYSEIRFSNIRKNGTLNVMLVYPNGPEQSADVDEILRYKHDMDSANAAQKSIGFVPDKDNTLNVEEIQNQVEVYAKHGYFRDAVAGKTSVVSGAIKKAFDVIILFKEKKLE
ncbi:hypothetical protein [Leuconostoc citreum]|uniref:hypothetical protein n=1 Tax=Leuconostoc citreum TaxID=33964 RepID=UPI001C1F41E9|nr:hypothetical protein [Leuconostoc citreum]MBU7450062.1 hypothetical protein [Leuconostoc citreum]